MAMVQCPRGGCGLRAGGRSPLIPIRNLKLAAATNPNLEAKVPALAQKVHTRFSIKFNKDH
jgi:hypothetical protein